MSKLYQRRDKARRLITCRLDKVGLFCPKGSRHKSAGYYIPVSFIQPSWRKICLPSTRWFPGPALANNAAVEKYKWLQLALCICHYACSIAIVVINATSPGDSFTVHYNFRYNLWDTKGDETCQSGCDITEKAYEYPYKLNVNILVSCFSFVSGTNHAIQFAAASGWLGTDLFDTWLERGYFWIRSIDFGVSAGLMLLANSILFYAPPDIQTLVLFFLVQGLTQLGGYSSEVLLANGLVKKPRTPSGWQASFTLLCGLCGLRFSTSPPKTAPSGRPRAILPRSRSISF